MSCNQQVARFCDELAGGEAGSTSKNIEIWSENGRLDYQTLLLGRAQWGRQGPRAHTKEPKSDRFSAPSMRTRTIRPW